MCVCVCACGFSSQSQIFFPIAHGRPILCPLRSDRQDAAMHRACTEKEVQVKTLGGPVGSSRMMPERKSAPESHMRERGGPYANTVTFPCQTILDLQGKVQRGHKASCLVGSAGKASATMRASSAVRVLCALGVCAALGPGSEHCEAGVPPLYNRGRAMEGGKERGVARHEPRAGSVTGREAAGTSWRRAHTQKFFLLGSGALEAVELLAQHQKLIPEHLRPARGFTIAAEVSPARAGGKVSSDSPGGLGRRVVAVNGTTAVFSDGRSHNLLALENVAMSEMRADAGIFLVGQAGTDSVCLSSVLSSALDQLLAGSALPVVAAVDAEILDRLIGQIDWATSRVLHVGGGSAVAPTIAAAAAAAAAEADIFAKLSLCTGSTLVVESWDAVAPAMACVLEELSVGILADEDSGKGQAGGECAARAAQKHKGMQALCQKRSVLAEAKGARPALDAAGSFLSFSHHSSLNHCHRSSFARPHFYSTLLPAPCSLLSLWRA